MRPFKQPTAIAFCLLFLAVACGIKGPPKPPPAAQGEGVGRAIGQPERDAPRRGPLEPSFPADAGR